MDNNQLGEEKAFEEYWKRCLEGNSFLRKISSPPSRAFIIFRGLKRRDFIAGYMAGFRAALKDGNP